MKAIIFDVDGTLADTERHGHLPACNATFAALNLPIQWTWDEYKTLLPLSGTAERMRRTLSAHTTLTPAEIEALVPPFEQLKRRFYIERYVPSLPLRPGVTRIVEQALACGVRLAIVSVSYEAQIHALLRLRLPTAYPHFAPILGRESGPKTGADGTLYAQCLAILGCAPAEVLVIEDSEVGFRAAKRAGLPCAMIYNDYTFGQDFAGAELVAKSLGFFDLDQLASLCLEDERQDAT